MQVAEQDGFAKRVLYYLTKNYNNQIKRADKYKDLKPAYFVGVLSDFSHTGNPHYISRNRIKDIDTGEETIKEIEFNFIELLKFNKTLQECETLTEKWIYFIKNAENLTVVPPDIDDEGLRSAYEEANQHTWTQAELDAYDQTDMRMGQARDEMDTAESRGFIKGKVETATQLKKLGISIEVIKEATGLSDSEIEKL